MQNPFSPSFGQEPLSLIERHLQNEEIIEGFLEEEPMNKVCLITGVRGSGKTVAMTTIGNQLGEHKDWIVLSLNPYVDLIHQLAAQLSNRRELMQIFKDAKINLSFLGLGVEIDGVPPITDTTVALRSMLQRLKTMKKKVLVKIDEVSSSENVKKFISQFQIYISEGLDIFLIMTGLYENIKSLKNAKLLTFLYRAPTIQLQPLNLTLMTDKYQEVFDISREEAKEMASQTKGFSYAFQLLGYLCWREKKHWTEVIPQYDQRLEEYVYEKIWSELSYKDREVVQAMAAIESKKVEDIRRELGMSSGQFTVYRNRLLKGGVISSPNYGYLEFALPRFKEFAVRMNTYRNE